MVYIQLPFPGVMHTFYAVPLFLTYTTCRHIACDVISHVFPIELLRDGFFSLIDSWVT